MILQNAGLKSQPESKCPELLANYCDMLLRKTPLSKKLTSDEIESKLRNVVSLLHVLVYILLTSNPICRVKCHHSELHPADFKSMFVKTKF